MAVSQRLELRQGQSLVMTPQLLQAIKILQLSHQELSAYVEAELERNPLLDTGEIADPLGDQVALGSEHTQRETDISAEASDWFSDQLTATPESLEKNFDSDLDNLFSGDSASSSHMQSMPEPVAFSPYERVQGNNSFDDENGPDLEATLASEISMRDHLLRQLDLSGVDPATRFIAMHVIEAIQDTGYLGEELSDIASRLQVPLDRVEQALKIIHTFEPTGMGARNIAECLALQLIEKNRFDPAMQALIANLDVLGKRDLPALKRICGVDDEDLRDMIQEVRQLDPKPGRAFGAAPVQLQIPDVFVRLAPDGNWAIELNAQTLPKVLVNQSYYAKVSRQAKTETDKAFLTECLTSANWLTRSLEQRAHTILKVAAEIVRYQDSFFAYGVEHLRPLTLKTVADAIGMHESTVSRVTANKAIGTSRGVFDMRYFFSTAVSDAHGGEGIAAESVRHRIKMLIESEGSTQVMTDDALVLALKQTGIDVARRTVAKYREAMGIPSSAQRKRERNMGLS
jgi:RNA polymerase sigma-54 factor